MRRQLDKIIGKIPKDKPNSPTSLQILYGYVGAVRVENGECQVKVIDHKTRETVGGGVGYWLLVGESSSQISQNGLPSIGDSVVIEYVGSITNGLVYRRQHPGNFSIDYLKIDQSGIARLMAM